MAKNKATFIKTAPGAVAAQSQELFEATVETGKKVADGVTKAVNNGFGGKPQTRKDKIDALLGRAGGELSKAKRQIDPVLRDLGKEIAGTARKTRQTVEPTVRTQGAILLKRLEPVVEAGARPVQMRFRPLYRKHVEPLYRKHVEPLYRKHVEPRVRKLRGGK